MYLYLHYKNAAIKNVWKQMRKWKFYEKFQVCSCYFQHARTNALRSLQESRSSPRVGNSRLNYFGLLKTNEGHFKRTLSKILIERVPDSTGSKTVRDFITGEMSSLGWSVQEDPFEEDTVIGKVKFTNIIATLNPVCNVWRIINIVLKLLMPPRDRIPPWSS